VSVLHVGRPDTLSDVLSDDDAIDDVTAITSLFCLLRRLVHIFIITLGKRSSVERRLIYTKLGLPRTVTSFLNVLKV
jgi:hypothetical protein